MITFEEMARIFGNFCHKHPIRAPNTFRYKRLDGSSVVKDYLITDWNGKPYSAH